MRKRIPLFAAFALGTLALGAFAIWGYFQIYNEHWVLKNNDQLILYSLKPMSDFLGNSPSGDNSQKYQRSEKFHKVVVLGKVQIDDPAIKKQHVDALYKGIADGGRQASCFDPRHGIRAVRGNRTIDVSICFGCGTTVFYDGNRTSSSPITNSAPKIFNQILDDAKIPRSEPRH
jgi:hypothetical protein